MNSPYTRAQIILTGSNDVTTFVAMINTECPTDKLVLENKNASIRINPRSILGILSVLADFNDTMYLVNQTNDGVYPNGLTRYRLNY